MPIGVTDSTTGNMGIGYGALYADAYRKVWSENGKLKGKMVFADEITKANNSFNWSGTITRRSAGYAVLDEFAKTPTPSPLPGEWRVHASKSGRYWVINTQAANYEGLRKCLYEDGSTGEFTWAGSGGYFKTRAAAQKVLDEYLGKQKPGRKTMGEVSLWCTQQGLSVCPKLAGGCVWVKFPSGPAQLIRDKLRVFGFKWSPTFRAWKYRFSTDV